MRTDANPAISAALFGVTRRRLLAELFGHPGERFHLRHLARVVGTGLGPVQRELERFAEVGLVTVARQGNLKLFEANPACPVYEELHALVRKTAGVTETLRDALRPIWPRVELAFVFGSVARGEERAESDVDVFVAGDVAFREVVAALAGAETSLSRAVNPVVYALDEVRERLARADHFVSRLWDEPKLWLKGDDRVLGELRASRLDQTTQSHSG